MLYMHTFLTYTSTYYFPLCFYVLKFLPLSHFFQYLCECQFDDNLKFKNIINEEDADAMRLQPIGRDKDGLMYWYQLDQEHNVRMYIEEQDDQDGSTWKCIVRYSFLFSPFFFPRFCRVGFLWLCVTGVWKFISLSLHFSHISYSGIFYLHICDLMKK